MDAYDHIQESTLAPEAGNGRNGRGDNGEGPTQNTLNADFQDAYKAISSSPWGARLGGFFGSVVKQVSSVLFCRSGVPGGAGGSREGGRNGDMEREIGS